MEMPFVVVGQVSPKYRDLDGGLNGPPNGIESNLGIIGLLIQRMWNLLCKTAEPIKLLFDDEGWAQELVYYTGAYI